MPNIDEILTDELISSKIRLAWDKAENTVSSNAETMPSNRNSFDPCHLMSDISTKLIQEVGRLTERFASDLIIDLESIFKRLSAIKDHDGEIYVLGIRRDGVDCNAFVMSQMRNGFRRSDWFGEYYRKIYAVEMRHMENKDMDRDDVRVELRDLTYSLPHEVWDLQHIVDKILKEGAS